MFIMQQIYCYRYTDTFTNGNIKLFVKSANVYAYDTGFTTTGC